MHGHGGLWLLVLLLVILPGLTTAGIVRRSTRGGKGGKGGRAKGTRGGKGGTGGWLDHRRKLHLERVKDENAKARDEVRHRQRIREQQVRDDRADERAERWGNRGGGRGGRPGGGAPHDHGGPGPGSAGGGDGSDGSPAPSPWRASVIRVWPNAPGWNPWSDGSGRSRLPFRWRAIGTRPGPGDPDAPAAPGERPATAGTPEAPGTPPVTSDPPPRDAVTQPPVSRPAPGPDQPPDRNQTQPEPRTIEGVIVTIMPDEAGALAVPGVEMIIEGAQALRRYMLAGNAQAKRRGVIGIAVAGDALAGTIRATARDMAEPGQHYGPEITDPLTMTAVHFTAAALGLSEVDGRIAAIIRAAEEMRASGVQAPHHDQMQVR